MKTFKQFLEAKLTDNIVSISDFLHDSCQPLVRELGPDLYENPTVVPMYRGLTINHEDSIDIDFGHDNPVKGIKKGYIKKVRTDRIPRDTHPQVSKILDDIFEKQFGWRPRSQSVFVFGSLKRHEAGHYGDLHRIFPMGDLKYVWSPKVTDLTGKLGDLLPYHGFVIESPSHKYDPEILKKIEEMLHDEIPRFDYTDENLYEALKSRSEIMIHCASYLAIPIGSA